MNVGIVCSVHGSMKNMLECMGGDYDRLTIATVIEEYSKLGKVFVFSHDNEDYSHYFPCGTKHIHLHNKWFYEMFSWLFIWYYIWKENIGILWLSNGDFLPIFMLNKLTKVKVLVQYDNTLWQTATNRYKRMILKGIERFMLNFIDYFVVTTENVRKFVGDKGFIVPGICKGIDINIYKPSKVKANDVYAGKKGIKILYVGRLSPEKDPITLVKAFFILRKGLLNKSQLFVCGDGILRQEVQEYADIDENVYILGNVKDVPSMLRGADIYVLPSVFDASPKSLMEAMAMGKACVVSAIDGAGEILDNCGTYFKAGDAEDLAHTIRFIIADKEWRRHCEREAKKKAVKCYDLRKNVRKQIEFLRFVEKFKYK